MGNKLKKNNEDEGMDITINIGKILMYIVLTIVFVVWKLNNTINWSWLWVLSPTWIPLFVAILTLLVFSFIVGIHSHYMEMHGKPLSDKQKITMFKNLYGGKKNKNIIWKNPKQ